MTNGTGRGRSVETGGWVLKIPSHALRLPFPQCCSPVRISTWIPGVILQVKEYAGEYLKH